MAVKSVHHYTCTFDDSKKCWHVCRDQNDSCTDRHNQPKSSVDHTATVLSDVDKVEKVQPPRDLFASQVQKNYHYFFIYFFKRYSQSLFALAHSINPSPTNLKYFTGQM